jgi:nickel-type superoxide dismutase maturation protease
MALHVYWIRHLTVQLAANAGRVGIVHWPLRRIAVAERSMEPALLPGDWLLVWRGLGTRSPSVKPGQLVIARHPGLPGMLLAKRVAWREAGGWWLTSDNPRAGGVDSFRFGPVPPDQIEGRVLLRYWPLYRR